MGDFSRRQHEWPFNKWRHVCTSPSKHTKTWLNDIFMDSAGASCSLTPPSCCFSCEHVSAPSPVTTCQLLLPLHHPHPLALPLHFLSANQLPACLEHLLLVCSLCFEHLYHSVYLCHFVRSKFVPLPASYPAMWVFSDLWGRKSCYSTIANICQHSKAS